MFQNKSIFITGGTGSFGKEFCIFLIKKKIPFHKIVLFSRDEFKQSNFSDYLKVNFPKDFKKIRFIIGDVRDSDRLKYALSDIDIVIHAAALKQVPAAEYNPIEFVKTNILGAQNIIESCFLNNVDKVIALSTDKAVAPKNLYGATKLCSDKLFISANNIIGKKKTKFSVVRYGNVNNSRGSVIPLFKHYDEMGKSLPVTNLNMTRFSIKMEDAINLVYIAMKKSFGGEIFIPKIKSYKLSDLVKAINPKKGYRITGVRYGEKMHEELINFDESEHIYNFGKYYIHFTDNLMSHKIKNSIKKIKKFKIEKKFSYNSKDNTYLSIKELRKILLEK
ncbi:UDP-N-acetylglucosamine 4,6-dehydratase (inverting) [bacterium]|nr:UDP-N-acetylglucosamine 4,6-dehydratase (inverting) [bacterium]